MKRSLFLVLSFTISLLALAPLAALGEGPPNYAVLKAGLYSPQDDDLDDLGADTGFNGELAFGHYFHQNLALEFGIGYFQTEGSASISDPFGSLSFDGEIKTYPVTVTAKLLVPAGGIELYGAAGIGIYFSEADITIVSTVPGIPSASASEDDTVLGFHIGAGANFNINPQVFAGIEGRYLFAEPDFGGLELKIDGFTVTANLGYRF